MKTSTLEQANQVRRFMWHRDCYFVNCEMVKDIRVDPDDSPAFRALKRDLAEARAKGVRD